MRRFLPLVLILVLALAALASGLVRQYQVFVQTPLDLQQAVVLEVSKGASMRRVLTDLERSGLTRANWRWRLFNRLYPVTIQAGEYALEPGMLPSDLLTLLASGRVIRYPFTIVEGWNQRDLLQALQAHSAIVTSMTDEDWPALLEELGAPVMHPEGLFLPETYRFPRSTTDRQLLGQAFALMREVLDEEWRRRGEESVVPTALASEHSDGLADDDRAGCTRITSPGCRP